jgi:ParB family chromosome partitioning protein
MVENGDLEMGHARALLGLSAEAQSQAARQVVAKGLSVRETEQLVRRLQAPVTDKPATPALDPDIRKLQEDLSAQLGAMVRIQHSARGKGRLVVLYNSIDELDGILAHLK